MKDMQISEDILPIGAFKTHVSRVVRKLKETNRPFVITQNGKPAAVLITPEEYDRLNEHTQILDSVDEGLSDSIAGRIIENASLARELDDIFGPKGK